MLPATGSTITAAMLFPFFAKNSLRRETSLKSSTAVCAAVSAGTPAELGLPKVRAPEPAFTSSESAWPW